TLQRKLALTAKVQDEVGHAQLIYRVVENLGKPREQCIADLVDGKAKFHNVFHYPTLSWGDIGVIAWLVDAAAIISQKALLKCSYAPYARIMKKICWEESFHILHGRDVILAMVTGSPAQFELVQEAVNRWWGPLMQFHGGSRSGAASSSRRAGSARSCSPHDMGDLPAGAQGPAVRERRQRRRAGRGVRGGVGARAVRAPRRVRRALARSARRHPYGRPVG